MKRLIISGLFFAMASLLHAQTQHTWERYFHDLQQMEDENSSPREDAFEVLLELEQHPIDLNTATREDLERIPFLTDQQIEDILAYVYQYHGMRSTAELMMIESLDATRRLLLTNFIVLSEEETKRFPTMKNILKRGRSSLMLTAKVPFYEREGDRNGYMGYKYSHSFRYKFGYGEYLQVGLVGAQDAGEPFFAGKNQWGYDHYSFYAIARKWGRMKTIVVGRYKLHWGMGLVANNDFGFGKLALLTTMGRTNNIIRPHSSRSQANYLQGAATTMALTKHTDASAFVSYRRIDATLNRHGGIQTILQSGYHRTEKEMERKHNATQTSAGGNLQWRNNGFHAGITGLFAHFDRPLEPDKRQVYRLFYPEGYDFWNVSVNYGYINHVWNINGETATGGCGSIATLNTLSFQASNKLTLTTVQRFYGYKYNAIFAESFSEGGVIRNENGLLLGANWLPTRHLTLTAYTDYAYFAKPRYGASAASDAWDNLVSATYSHGKIFVAARYRLKIRTKNNAKKTQLVRETTQRGSLSLAYEQPKWTCKTRLDFTFSDYKTKSSGYMVSEQFAYQPLKWLQLIATTGFFHTDDFASRIYLYERGTLYSFNFPTFYGKGVRATLFARANPGRWMFILKAGTTRYRDRRHISSGLQRINASSMTDVEMQVRWKF